MQSKGSNLKCCTLQRKHFQGCYKIHRNKVKYSFNHHTTCKHSGIPLPPPFHLSFLSRKPGKSFVPENEYSFLPFDLHPSGYAAFTVTPQHAALPPGEWGGEGEARGEIYLPAVNNDRPTEGRTDVVTNYVDKFQKEVRVIGAAKVRPEQEVELLQGSGGFALQVSHLAWLP